MNATETAQEQWSTTKINGIKNQYKASPNKDSDKDNFDVDEYKSDDDVMEDDHASTMPPKPQPEWQKSIKDKRYRISFPGIII